jgi:kynureninase
MGRRSDSRLDQRRLDGSAARRRRQDRSLIGAGEDESVVADSTSVNLFKVLAAALKLRPGRLVILSERSNFPTDLYIAQGLATMMGSDYALRLVETSEIEAALGSEIAVVMLTHADYRSGRLWAMKRITALAHSNRAALHAQRARRSNDHCRRPLGRGE